MLKTYKLYSPYCKNYNYPKTFGVYGFFDLENKKLVYIGKTKNSFKQRWSRWRADAKTNINSAARKLYENPNRFLIVILKEYDYWNSHNVGLTLYWEARLIDYFKPKFNTQDLGIEFDKRNYYFTNNLSFTSQEYIRKWQVKNPDKVKLKEKQKIPKAKDFFILNSFLMEDPECYVKVSDFKQLYQDYKPIFVAKGFTRCIPATKIATYFGTVVKNKTINKKTERVILGIKFKDQSY